MSAVDVPELFTDRAFEKAVLVVVTVKLPVTVRLDVVIFPNVEFPGTDKVPFTVTPSFVVRVFRLVEPNTYTFWDDIVLCTLRSPVTLEYPIYFYLR